MPLTYDPLEPEDVALLARERIEGSMAELQADGLINRLNFLAGAGFFSTEQTHFARDHLNHRYRFTRTAKGHP